MAVRALPMAPGHDGIRLILPSVASFAILAGLGASFLAQRSRRSLVAWLVALACLGECLVGIVRLYPYTDSYYNAAFGGLSGAERRGFELTYYWETAGPEFLRWVRRESANRPLALSMEIPQDFHDLLHEWGELPPGVRITLPNVVGALHVYQRRRAFWIISPQDWWLDQHGTPLFVIRREGVDLLRVYPHEQWKEAMRRATPAILPPLEGP